MPTDAELFADLAIRIFHDTYAATNHPDDMSAYITNTYSPAHQLAEITSPDITTLLAVTPEPIAFAQLRSSPTPACLTFPYPVELWRFYVDHAWHGQGIAGQLMRAVLEIAVDKGHQSVWLGVWERNPRAIAFYRKWGFVDVGTQAFQLGTDVQTDRILMRGVGTEVVL